MSRVARRRARAGLQVGAVIVGRYRLEEHLGEGGMAEVFRAEDLHSRRSVAVKVLRADIATNPEAVERAKREGEILSQLDNPAIVEVETWGELEDGGVFLVMELLEGETLGARMRRGPMDPAELTPIVAGTCAGLHAAHAKGVVHRDLKPDNIFLCPTEHGLQVKLLDFGISKVYGGEKLTQTGEVLGTPRYMSPEQLGAEPDVDARVDVYALGVMLYEALAGRPPFLGSTPTDLIVAILNGKVAPLRAVRPELPEEVESVVMRALNRVRVARFDTAMAMAEAYVDAAGGVVEAQSQQRRGMATRAMGGMRSAPSSPREMLAGDDVVGNLRLGTFSGTEASPEGQALGHTIAMGASGGASPPPPGPPLRVEVERDASWVAYAATQEVAETKVPKARAKRQATESPASPSAPSVAATALLDASEVGASQLGASQLGTSQVGTSGVGAWQRDPSGSIPDSDLVLPVRKVATRSRVILVVAALLAGALSAGAVIAVLQLYDGRTREAPDVSEDAPEPAGEERSEDGAGADRAGDRAADEIQLDEAEQARLEEVSPQEAAPEEPVATKVVAAPVTRRAPRVTPPREAEPEPTARPAPSDDPSPTLPGFGTSEASEAEERTSTLGGAIPRAQDALPTSGPEPCIAILDDATRQGALALRRRGDCYEAAGQREAAVRDYQRFCRLFPDHPSIADVRPILQSWGHSCP